MTDSAIARQAVTEGLATEDALREIAEGWRRWAAHPDAWYAVLHGEILLPRVAIPALEGCRRTFLQVLSSSFSNASSRRLRGSVSRSAVRRANQEPYIRTAAIGGTPCRLPCPSADC